MAFSTNSFFASAVVGSVPLLQSPAVPASSAAETLLRFPTHKILLSSIRHRQKACNTGVWGKADASGLFSARQRRQLSYPETARTAGRSGSSRGTLSPALSPAFFHTGPAPRLASAISLVSAQIGETSLIPLLRLFPPNPLPLGFGGSPLVSHRRPQFASKTLVGAATLPTFKRPHRAHSGDDCLCCLFLLY